MNETMTISRSSYETAVAALRDIQALDAESVTLGDYAYALGRVKARALWGEVCLTASAEVHNAPAA